VLVEGLPCIAVNDSPLAAVTPLNFRSLAGSNQANTSSRVFSVPFVNSFVRTPAASVFFHYLEPGQQD